VATYGADKLTSELFEGGLLRLLTSGYGPKPTSNDCRRMSAFGGIADIAI